MESTTCAGAEKPPGRGVLPLPVYVIKEKLLEKKSKKSQKSVAFFIFVI